MNVFDVGITISLVDKVSSALGQITRGLYQGQMAATALNNKLASIHKTFNSGLIMAAGGMALAAPLIKAENAAEKLEYALNRVQVATQASNSEMAQFSKHLSQVSNVTGIFSKPMLADFAAEMRASGINTLPKINSLIELFAKGADVMKVTSGGKISPTDVAHGFAGLAHQFGKFDPNEMKPIVEAATRIAPGLPGGMKTLLGMGSYVNIIGSRTLGIDPRELMALEATVAQTSAGKGTGRGQLSAANLINALQRSIPGVFGGGLLEGQSAYSSAVLGLTDKHGLSTVFKKTPKGGKMDVELLMNKFFNVFHETQSAEGRYELAQRMNSNLDHLSKKQRANMRPMIDAILASHGEAGSMGQLLTMMFSKQGGAAKTMMTLFSDPQFQAQFEQMKKMAFGGDNIETMQEKVSQSTHFQRMRAATNVETLLSSFGMAMLPPLKKLFVAIADTANQLNTWVEMHPRITKMIAAVWAGTSALLVFGGGVLMLRTGVEGLRFLFGGVVAQVLRLGPALMNASGFMGMLRAAMIPLGPLGLVIAGALTGVAIALWAWPKMLELIHKNADLFVVAAANVAHAFDMMTVGARAAAMQIQQAFAGAANWVSNTMGKIQGNEPVKQQGDAFWTGKGSNDLLGGVMNLLHPKAADVQSATAYLKATGRGGIINQIKGIADDQKGASSNKPIIVNHQTVNVAPGAVHIDGRGHDVKQMEHHVRQGFHNAVNDLRHKATAMGRGGGIPNRPAAAY